MRLLYSLAPFPIYYGVLVKFSMSTGGTLNSGPQHLMPRN